jgi:hypothetical protein
MGTVLFCLAFLALLAIAMRPGKECCLCGAQGHTSPHCPWRYTTYRGLVR